MTRETLDARYYDQPSIQLSRPDGLWIAFRFRDGLVAPFQHEEGQQAKP